MDITNKTKESMSALMGLKSTFKDFESSDVDKRISSFIPITEQSIYNKLCKMKGGVFTKTEISIEADALSDCRFVFRLLSALEELEIEEKLAERKFNLPGTLHAYTAAHILSKATSAPTGDAKPELTPEDFLGLLDKQLLSYVYTQYDNFTQRHNPHVGSISEEEINQILTAVEEDVYNPKKLISCFLDLNLNRTQELNFIAYLIISLLTVKEQMDKLPIVNLSADTEKENAGIK
jgi:hypothetical protein